MSETRAEGSPRIRAAARREVKRKGEVDVATLRKVANCSEGAARRALKNLLASGEFVRFAAQSNHEDGMGRPRYVYRKAPEQ